MLSVVVDLDYALQAGMGTWFRKPSYLEFLLLRQLGEERHKLEIEQIEKKSTHG